MASAVANSAAVLVCSGDNEAASQRLERIAHQAIAAAKCAAAIMSHLGNPYRFDIADPAPLVPYQIRIWRRVFVLAAA